MLDSYFFWKLYHSTSKHLIGWIDFIDFAPTQCRVSEYCNLIGGHLSYSLV